MSDKKKELQAIISKAREELDLIETAERMEQNRALVGKCFIYENSYGQGEKWPLYQRVIGIKKSGRLEIFAFERDSLGEIKIYTETCPTAHGKPCTLKQFKAAWRRISKQALAMGEKALA